MVIQLSWRSEDLEPGLAAGQLTALGSPAGRPRIDSDCFPGAVGEEITGPGSQKRAFVRRALCTMSSSSRVTDPAHGHRLTVAHPAGSPGQRGRLTGGHGSTDTHRPRRWDIGSRCGAE